MQSIITDYVKLLMQSIITDYVKLLMQSIITDNLVSEDGENQESFISGEFLMQSFITLYKFFFIYEFYNL